MKQTALLSLVVVFAKKLFITVICLHHLETLFILLLQCRNLLITDAKRTFISQIPEPLKEDLIKRLRLFSKEKQESPGSWSPQVIYHEVLTPLNFKISNRESLIIQKLAGSLTFYSSAIDIFCSSVRFVADGVWRKNKFVSSINFVDCWCGLDKKMYVVMEIFSWELGDSMSYLLEQSAGSNKNCQLIVPWTIIIVGALLVMLRWKRWVQNLRNNLVEAVKLVLLRTSS